MSTAAIAVMPTALRPKYIVLRYIFCQSRSCSSGFSPTRICRSPQAMLWLNGASMIALTTSGDESASPTPSSPVSVRTRTSTESWLLAVFAWMFGMRRIWQTTSVIFMERTVAGPRRRPYCRRRMSHKRVRQRHRSENRCPTWRQPVRSALGHGTRRHP